MLKGTVAENEEIAETPEALVIEDTFIQIIKNLDLRSLLSFRQVSARWKTFIELFSPAPLLTSAAVHQVEEYIRNESGHPNFLGNPQSIGFYAKLKPIADSKDAVEVVYTSKHVELIRGEWVNSKSSFSEVVDTKQVVMISDKARYSRFNSAWPPSADLNFLNTEFLNLTTREDRDKFIKIFVQSTPIDDQRPRWCRLLNQSIDSLERLKQSLNRYTNPQFSGCVVDVDKAICHKLTKTHAGYLYPERRNLLK